MRQFTSMLRSATVVALLLAAAPAMVDAAEGAGVGVGVEASPAAGAITGTPGGSLDVDAVVVVIDRAIAALTEEQRLVTVTAPGDTTASGPGGTLASVDHAGAAALASLRDLGVTPTPAMRETLQLLPRPGSGSAVVPPTPARYAQALTELRTLRQELLGGQAPGAGQATDASGGSAGDGSAGDSDGSLMTTLAIAALVLAGIALVLLLVLLPRRRGERSLAALALRDDLTGVGNRRHLNQALTAEPARGDRPTSVLMVDIDHFKQFNDHHGHHVGDEVLKAVAGALCDSVRAGDVVYRYGGEEFCVLLDDVSPGEAATIAERVRCSAGQVQLPSAGPITVSVGLAHGPATEVSTTLRRADTALIDAKRDGRDRVNVSTH